MGGVRYRVFKRFISHILFVPLCLALLWTSGLGSWHFVTTDIFTAFDMYSARLGLAAMDNSIVRTLVKYKDGHLTGFFSPDNRINSIMIRDSNIAFFTVENDGVYMASGLWGNVEKILQTEESHLLSVKGTSLLLYSGNKVYFSANGVNYTPTTGFMPGDSIYAIESYNQQVYFAAADRYVYRSNDGGKSWFRIIDSAISCKSIYIDHSNNFIYVGGLKVMRSSDAGNHWETLSSIFFPGILNGQLVGTPDCSGAFYLAPNAYHGNLYRSVSHGKFFQDVGPSNSSSIRMLKGAVFDRGSTFYWLDEGGLWSVSNDGVDSTLSDSIGSAIDIGTPPLMHSSLCDNNPTDYDSLTIGFDACTGVYLDSLRAIVPNQAFTISFSRAYIAASQKRLPVSFKARKTGLDSVVYKLSIHSGETNISEAIYITLYGMGDATAPIFGTSESELDFGPHRLDSIISKSISIINNGCDTLDLLNISSSNDSLFHLKPVVIPAHLIGGQKLPLTIFFAPKSEGLYLETIILSTNLGNRFITMTGTGVKKPVAGNDVVAPDVPSNEIALYPNPVHSLLTITAIAPTATIAIVDAVGRSVSVTSLAGTSTNSLLIDMTPFPSGIYHLSINGSILEHGMIVKY